MTVPLLALDGVVRSFDRGRIVALNGLCLAVGEGDCVAVTGRSLSALWAEIEAQYGAFEMYESDFKFSAEKKGTIYKLLMEDKLLPAFELEIDHVSYIDGCKVYFKNGGWAIARFSGTEPLLRIFCEMNSMALAEKTAKTLQQFLAV